MPHEGLHGLRIELGPGHPAQLRNGDIRRPRVTVGTPGSHGVERIGHGHDASLDRNLLSP